MQILKFEASWCMPCKSLSANLAKSDHAMKEKIVVVDIDKQPDMVLKYGVRSVPTMIVVDDTGSALKSKSGTVDSAALIKFLDDAAELA